MKDRTEYIEKMSARLKEWDAEIQKLEAKAESARADLRDEYLEKVRDLRSKKEEAKGKLNKIRESGDDAWKELRDGLETSWKVLGDSVKSAMEKFK